LRYTACMSRETFVFFIGIILTLLPFLGIPEDWKQYAVATLGAFLILVGYMLRRKVYFTRIDHGNGERGDGSFVETTKQLFE
jgi:heme/copper-type cytochrome/quinol oxidase subunit 4